MKPSAVVLVATVLCVTTWATAQPTPPLSVVGRRTQYPPEAFTFDLAGQTPIKQRDGFTVRLWFLDTAPVLAGEGLCYGLVDLDPCAVYLPHVHPRGAEMLYMIKGTKLQVGYVEDFAVRVVESIITVGEAFHQPQGLIHYQLNLGCEPAQFISAINSEDPGNFDVPMTLFMIDEIAVAQAFNIPTKRVGKLGQRIESGPDSARKECLQRCGLV